MNSTHPAVRGVVAAALAAIALVSHPLAQAAADREKQARLEWFREAKYGLFIHWGLYAIPAGEWKGQRVPGLGEWIMNRAKVPVKEYEQLAGRFNPVKFNADQWVQLAKDAGMKYIVITSKHHDGFAMFDSKVSRYDVVDATPFKRDVLKELADACAKQGMRLGLLLLPGAGLARAERRGQHVGFRARREEGLRPVPAEQGGAAGQGVAERLWARGARLVRYAADDDRRARPAVRRHRAIAAAEHAHRRPARRSRRLRHDR